MLPDLTLTHWLTLHVLVTAFGVLVYVVSSHVTQQRRHPSAAIAWILFILLLPYLALPIFIAFGSRKLARPQTALAALPSTPRSPDLWAIETILALGQPAPAAYSDLRIHDDGVQARAVLLEMIDSARSSIDVCTFILGRDRLGSAVIERLCLQARRGVRVRLLLDGMGRMMQRHPNLKPLKDAGGEFALFVPPWHSPLKGRTNLRDHRKLLVIDAGLDSARLWCGGRNLALPYFDGEPGQSPWRDLSFDLRGALVQQASALFEHDWAFANGLPAARTAAGPEAAQAVWAEEPAPTATAQLVASGPDQADDTLYSLLVTAAYRAREHIALVTPYFVPESALLMALCLAARRGVSVDVLLPARSNHLLSDLARSRALRSLAAAGGRIWLSPGMLHAKLAVIDRKLALAGSANLDSRSLFLNYELMLAFHDRGDAQRFADWFEAERRSARRYLAKRPGLVRDVAEGMLLWLGFQL